MHPHAKNLGSSIGMVVKNYKIREKEEFDPIAAVPGGNGVEDGGREEPKEINHCAEDTQSWLPNQLCLVGLRYSQPTVITVY